MSDRYDDRRDDRRSNTRPSRGNDRPAAGDDRPRGTGRAQPAAVAVRGASTPVPAAPRTSLQERAGLIVNEIRESIESALPSDISFDQFRSVTIIALGSDPGLFNCEPATLKMALLRCAHDRLLPDKREAVILPFKERKFNKRTQEWEGRLIAQYLPMVGGIRKRAAQLGGITSIVCECVYANEVYESTAGFNPEIFHRKVRMGEPRGKLIGVYAVFFRGPRKPENVVHSEEMTIEEVERARASSKAPDSPAWKNWYEEMCRKTVIKRGAKGVTELPPELRDLLDRDDEPTSTIDASSVPTSAPRLDRNPLAAIPSQQWSGQPVADDEGWEPVGAPVERHDPETGEVIYEPTAPAPKGGSAVVEGDRGPSPRATKREQKADKGEKTAPKEAADAVAKVADDKGLREQSDEHRASDRELREFDGAEGDAAPDDDAEQDTDEVATYETHDDPKRGIDAAESSVAATSPQRDDDPDAWRAEPAAPDRPVSNVDPAPQRELPPEPMSFNDQLWDLVSDLRGVDNVDDLNAVIAAWRKHHKVVVAHMPHEHRTKIGALKAAYADVIEKRLAPQSLPTRVGNLIGGPIPEGIWESGE